jgi:hypothetical protein
MLLYVLVARVELGPYTTVCAKYGDIARSITQFVTTFCKVGRGRRLCTLCLYRMCELCVCAVSIRRLATVVRLVWSAEERVACWSQHNYLLAVASRSGCADGAGTASGHYLWSSSAKRLWRGVAGSSAHWQVADPMRQKKCRASIDAVQCSISLQFDSHRVCSAVSCITLL